MRGTSLELWQRVQQLIVLTSGRNRVTRESLADEWGCTIRNASYIIDHARDFYGVKIEWVGLGRDGSYALVDPGVFDLHALRRFARRSR